MTIEARDIWGAIDEVAERRGVSIRTLASESGLHFTTLYNRKEGDHFKWPSSKSISAICETAGISFVEFAAIVEHQASVTSLRTAA